MATNSAAAQGQLAEATVALQGHLDSEEIHVKRMRQKLQEDLDAKLPTHLTKRAKDKESPSQSPSPSDTIKLNVGGDVRFATRRDTLTVIPGSRLAQLFSGRWDSLLRKDEQGRVFLDVDPGQFKALLTWLVDLKRIEPDSAPPSPPVDSLPQRCRAGFLSLCSYLCSQRHLGAKSESMGLLGHSNPLHELADGSVVTVEQAKQLISWLQEPTQAAGEPCLKLLFRASRDGFSAQAFHQKCDGQGPTVVVARSAGGHVFGGYTEIAWDCSNSFKECRESFLFRLAGPGTQPSKHVIMQKHQNGIYCHANQAAQFGAAPDMRIFPEGAAAKVSFAIGSTYTTISPQGTFAHLAEAPQAVVTDFEVLQVQRKVDLRVAAQSFQAHAKLLKPKLELSQQDLFDKALAMFAAALDQGQSLFTSKESLSSWCNALDEEAQFLSQFMGSADDIVRLNVGGELMETVLSTLTYFSDSTLAKKFADNWTLQREEVLEGGVFFDEDSELFQVILLHLRLGRLLGNTFRPRLPPGKNGPWKRLLKYLNMPALINEDWGSELLADHADDLVSMFGETMPSSDQELSLRLLFRASKDGFSPQVFHQKCDGHGPTVVVARSAGGHIFGGYTEASWACHGNYTPCRESFLFHLAGPGSIRPSKHKIHQNHQHGIYCNQSYFPTFGGGHDMHILPEGTGIKAIFGVGPTYNSSSPQGTFAYLAEAQTCSVTDFEVFAVAFK